MDIIEKKISNFIQSQFPAHYRDNGPMLVAFVTEYYKWLESQDQTLYHTRRILDYKDIDTTVDRFIIYFKNKYLTEIQFNTETNIKQIVKHSLDLYRSKGTERGVDLLFRLVFGVGAEVYYPASDLMRLSDGKWKKPTYLEVTLNDNNIRFSNKQIRGLTSEATAFVESVIRRIVAGRLIDVLYISAVNGNFQTEEVIIVDDDEVLRNERIKVIGSLTEINIDVNGTGFGYEVGDIVDLYSDKGRQAKGRITSTTDINGLVKFELINGGYGYDGNAEVIISEKVLSVSDIGLNPNNITNSYFKIFETLVQPMANISYSDLSGATSIANGTMLYTYHSNNLNKGVGRVIASTANSSTNGVIRVAIISGKIKNQIANFNANTQVNGSAEFITLSSQPFDNNDIVLYTTSTGNTALSGLSNNTLYFIVGANSTGVKLSTTSYGTPRNITASSVSETGHNLTSISSIYSGSNTFSANQVSYTDRTATANIIGISNTVSIQFTGANGNFTLNEEVYQLNSNNDTEIANGVITSFARSVGANGSLRISNVYGIFKNNLYIRSRLSNAVVNSTSIGFNIGVYDISNSFVSNTGNYVYSSNTLSNATISVISQGTGATFQISNDVLYTETLYDINTDYIKDYANTRLNVLVYGFPANSAANLSYGTLETTLDIKNINIGKISAIVGINRGEDYNIPPFVLIYQPEIYHFRKKDTVLSISGATTGFALGELVEQTSTNARGIIKQGSNSSTLFVERLRFYDPVYTNSVFNANSGVANATDIITTSSPHGLVNNDIITYIVSTGNTTIGGLSNGATYYVVNSTTASTLKLSSTASGSPIDITAGLTETGHTLSKKNFANGVGNSANFNVTTSSLSQISGVDSGFTANVVSINEDANTLYLGLNSFILSNTIIGDGSITGMQVVDSGFGFVNGETVSFENENGISTGIAVVSTQGKSLGFYQQKGGFLSDQKKLHDGNYYQEYSYEVRSSVMLNKYSDMLKKILHVSGTKFFGALIYKSVANTPTNISSFVVTKSNVKQLVTETGDYLILETGTGNILETES